MPTKNIDPVRDVAVCKISCTCSFGLGLVWSGKKCNLDTFEQPSNADELTKAASIKHFASMSRQADTRIDESGTVLFPIVLFHR